MLSAQSLVVLVLFSSGWVWFVLANPREDALKNDWQEIHYKIYSNKGYPLVPDEVLEHLKALEKIYTGREDSNSINRMQKVRRLIEVSDLSVLKCDQEYFEDLKLLTLDHSPFWLHIQPYLRHYTDQRMRLCKEFLTEKILEGVERISEEDKRVIEYLMNLVALEGKPNEGGSSPELKPPFHQDQIFAGTEAFMELLLQQQIEPREDYEPTKEQKKKKKRDNYNELFIKLIGESCKRLRKELGPLLHLGKNVTYMDKKDKAVKWLNYTIICSFIAHNMELVMEQSRKHIERKLSPKGKVNKFLRKLVQLC